MNFNPLLWFVCRFCKQAMPDLDRLKAHTLDNHMGECLEGVQIECIVFEESILDHECATASKAKKNAHPKTNKVVSSVNVNSKKPQNHITNCTPSAPSISEQEGTPTKIGMSPSVALTRLSPKKVDPPKVDETKTKTTKYIAGPKCYKAKKRKLSNSISSSFIKENDENKDSPAPKQNRLQPSHDKICEKLNSVISKETEVIVIDDDDDEPQENPVPSSSEAEAEVLDVNEECEAEATLELDDQSGLFLIRNPDGTVTEITNGDISPEPEPEAILISIPAIENFDIHEHADLLKINQVPAEPHQQAFSTTIPDCFSVLNDSVTVSIADSTAANFEFQLLLNNSNDSQNESQGGANITISTQNNDLAGPASSDTSVLDVSAEIGTLEEQKQLQQLRQDVGMDFNFNTAGKNGKKIKKKFVAVLKKKMMKESSLNSLNSRREEKQVYAKQQLEVVSVPSDSDASYTEISSTSTIVNSNNNNYSNLSNSDSDSISIPNNIHYEDTQELDNQQFFISSANISQLSISNEMDVEIVADSEQDDPNSTPILTPVPISVQFQFPSTEAFTSATNTITTSSTQEDFDDFDDGMNLEQLKLKQQLQLQQQPQLVGYTSISDFIGCLGAPAEQHQQQEEEEPMKDSVSSSSVVTIPTSNFDFELIHGTNSEVDSNNYLNPKNAIITCDSSDLAADLIIERNTDIVHENRNKFQESTELVPPDTTVANDNDKENGEEGTTSLPLELQESSSSLSPPPMIDVSKSIESQNDESENHQSNACNNTDYDENTLQTIPSEIEEDDEHQNKLQNIQSEIQEEPQNNLQTGEHPDVIRVEYRERSRSPVPVTQQTEDQTIFLMDNDFIDYACEEVVETSSSSAEATGESTVTEEIATPSEIHPDFEPTVDAAECGDEIQNEGGDSVEIETSKDTNDVTIVEAEKVGGDVNVSSLDNQLQNQAEVENDEISETVNPHLPSPETTTAETEAEREPEKTEEQRQQSQPELVDLPSASMNCEAPQVVDTEKNCETPEVGEDTQTNCEVPEVVDADTNCETPEVRVATETNCEVPEVVDADTNCETPEVRVATETNCEVPEAVDAEISVTTSVATTDVTYDDGNNTSEASFGLKNGVADPKCSPFAQENLSLEPGPEPENENTSLPKNTAETSDNMLNKDDAYIENGKIPVMDPLSAYYSNISESESEIDESFEAISPTTTTSTTTTTTATPVTTTEINVSTGDSNSNEDSNKNTTTKLNGSLVFIPMAVPAPASTSESESVLPKKAPSLSRTLSHYDTWRKMSKNNLALPTENTTTSANFLQHNPKIKNHHFEDRLDEEQQEVFIPSPTPVTVTTLDDVLIDARKSCESDQNKKELPQHQQLPLLPQKFRNHIRKKLMSGKKKKLKLIKKKLKKSACISIPKVRLVFDDKKTQSDNEEEKEVENDIGAENSLDVEEGETQAPILPPSPIRAPIVIPIADSLKSNPKSLSSKTDLGEEKKVEEDPKSQVESSPIQSQAQKEQEEDEQVENISSPQPKSTPFKLKLKPSSTLGSVSPKSPKSNKSGGKKKIAVVATRTTSKSKLNSNVKKKIVSSRRHSHNTTHSPVESQGKNDADDDIQIVFISDDKVTPKGRKTLSKYQDVACIDDESSDGGGSDLDYKPTNHHAKTKTKIRSKAKPKIRNNKFKFNTQQKTKRQKLREILKKPSVKTRASIAAPSAVKSSIKSKLLSKKSNEKSTTSKLQLSMIQSNQIKKSQKEPPQSQTKPVKKGTFLSSNSLVRWLALQKELSNSKSIKFPNVILLDPDPTLMTVTSSEPPRQTSSGGKPWQTSAGSTPGNTPTIKPRFEINRDNPVTCKLCSQKLISELQLQNHVENCWLHNKQRHRFCIICNRGFDNPVQLTQHNKSEHSDNSIKVSKVTASPASGRVTVPVSPISSSSSTKAKIGLPLLTPRPKRSDDDGKEVDDRQKPKPKNVVELSLKQWLVKEAKMNPSNVIALDPDPVSTSKTLIPVSKSSPIKCKLCQAYLPSESRVKKHVALCWTSNKSKHLHCVPCNKTFAYTKGFQRHNMDKHLDSWKDRRQAKKVVRRDWELEEEEEDPPLAKRVKLTKEKSAVESVPAPARALLVKDATVPKPKPKLQPSPIHIPAPVGATTVKPKTHSKQEKLPVPVVRLEPVKDIVKPVVCKICSMTFNVVSALTRHIEQVHTRERPHKCPHCPATYETLEEFRRHVGIHGKVFSPDKREPCRKQVNFKTTPEKNQRDRIHKGVTHTLKCSVVNCTATCTSHSSLSQHLRLKHNIESPKKQVQEQFICPTFDLQDELTRSLKLRRRTLDKDNNNSKPYKCTHNNCAISGFRTKIQLDKHVKDEHRKAVTPPTPIATTTSRKRKLSQHADADRHAPVPTPVSVSSTRNPNSTPTLNRPTPKVRCLSPDICDF